MPTSSMRQVDDRPVRAAAYDPCQPDQLQIQGKYRHSFWSEIYETVLACISHHRRWWR